MQKQLLIIINGILLIAVAVLFYLHFKGNCTANAVQDDKPVKIANIPVITKNLKIAYLNSDSLLSTYKFSKKKNEEFTREIKTKSAELDKMKSVFQKQINEAEQKFQSLSPSEQDAMKTVLGRKQQEIAAREQELQNSVMVKQQEFSKQMYDTIVGFIKKSDLSKKFDYIYATTNSGLMLIYSNDSLNITKQIVGELNNVYDRRSKSKK